VGGIDTDTFILRKYRSQRIFFECFAAAQLARQLQQERTQVVCSNREAQKCPARGHSRNGPWTLKANAYTCNQI